MKYEDMITDIPVGAVLPCRYGPRFDYSEKHICELVESIKKWGIIQPIIVRKLSDKYEIIDGEYRLRAAKQADLKTVPAIVVDGDTVSVEDIASMSCAINYHTEKYSLAEEARMYQITSKAKISSLERLGEITGVPQSRIDSCRPLMEPERSSNIKYSSIVEKLKNYLIEMGLDDYTVGADLEYNYYINIDEDGYIFVSDGNPAYDLCLRRVRTAINADDIIEFRKSEIFDNAFYMLDAGCSGLWITEDGVYYIHKGEASGWGTAYEYFTKFPNNEGFIKQ